MTTEFTLQLASVPPTYALEAEVLFRDELVAVVRVVEGKRLVNLHPPADGSRCWSFPYDDFTKALASACAQLA